MGLEIIGESPDLEGVLNVENEEAIARYAIVTLEKPEPGRLVMRTVPPREYATFSGLMYQIDRGKLPGVTRLRQMRMAFFPLDESEG
jgi:hypothetical protein